jgi:hypothetical protein
MILTKEQGDLPSLIEAGRRAAYDALVESASKLADGTWQPYQPHAPTMAVNNFDIAPAIDAAVMETLVRLMPEPKRRPWWRFW